MSATGIAQKPLHSVVSKSKHAADKTPIKPEEPQHEGITKQERMLELLSWPEGASIEEMMQAIDW
jgi:hypothetical protein